MKRWFERTLSLLNFVLFIAVGFALYQHFTFDSKQPQSRKAAQNSALVGERISLPGYNWSSHKKTLVLALQTGCHFCSESSPFHRQLVDLIHGDALHSDIGLAAIFPQSHLAAKALLDAEAVALRDDEIKELDFTAWGIQGTPTLVLVDNEGHVEKSWTGKLTPDRESDVFETLRLVNDEARDRQQYDTAMGNQVFSIDLIDVNNLSKLREMPIVDVRSRPEFRASHIEGAVNIPTDELLSRATHELDVNESVAIFCQYHSDCQAPLQKRGILTPCTGAYLVLRSLGFTKSKLISSDIDSTKSAGIAVVGEHATTSM